MLHTLKQLTGYLPERCQQSMKRRYFAWQIRHGTFATDEPEYRLLTEVLSPCDWVIDVGANIGHYTLKMSQLVGPEGRVIALEPIPRTFELLAANSALSPCSNITLMNVAASSGVGLVNMEVPEWERGGRLNYYEARVTPGSAGKHSYPVFTLSIDSLGIPHRISCVKIDAEGHELEVVEGMARLLKRDYPVLIVEGEKASAFLRSLGYRSERRSGSPNCLWRHNGG